MSAAPSGVSRLPKSLTSFVNREADLEACLALLRRPDVRLLTLVGPGGVGKTRLALELARSLEDAFEVIAFASLATTRDPELVPAAVAEALGLQPLNDRSVIGAARELLADRTVLLVLDSVEAVVEASPWLAELLVHCPGLTTLATSRVRLAVYGEHVYTVDSLFVPDPVRHQAPDAPADTSAVRLFELRAQAVLPDFALDETTLPAVTEICRRLDGLPLAIELAAARVHILHPPVLLARLEARLPLLVSGYTDMPARHRTMRDAIAWSYDLLTPTERRIFRRLAVFAGGFSLEAAEEVCAATGTAEDISPSTRVWEVISALVDQSLMQAMHDDTGATRFAMLETIREFGLEELAAANEEFPTRQAHANYVLALAEAAENALTGPERTRWLGTLREERDNLRAALTWGLESDNAELALRLGAALWRFWASEGALREGRAWLERGLAAGGHVDPAIRAKALHYLGNLTLDLGDHEHAKAPYGASLSLRRELDDRQGIAATLTGLGLVALIGGEYTRARRLHEESLEVERSLQNRHGEALSLHDLGQTATAAGDLDTARERFAAALAIMRELHDPVGVAFATWGLGEAARRQGRIADARTLLEEALAGFQTAGDRLGIAHALHGLAHCDAGERDAPLAAERFREALALRREHGERGAMIASLEGLAALAADQGDIGRAVRWWSAADAERRVRRAPLPAVDRPAHESALARARAALDGAAFNAAWAAGSLASFDRIVEEALAFVPTPAKPSEPSATSDDQYGLTARERDVLRLMMEGLTDQQIAETLHVSHRTVSTHVGHILAKLDVRTRTAAAALATRNNLV